MLEFFLVLAVIAWVIRWGVKQQEPQAAEKWARRWERLAPFGRHVVRDVKATRQHMREARAARRFRKGF
jgi:hypothetical protein